MLVWYSSGESYPLRLFLSLSSSSASSAPPSPKGSSSSLHLSAGAMGAFHPSIVVPCQDCSTRRELKFPSLETASSNCTLHSDNSRVCSIFFRSDAPLMLRFPATRAFSDVSFFCDSVYAVARTHAWAGLRRPPGLPR